MELQKCTNVVFFFCVPSHFYLSSFLLLSALYISPGFVPPVSARLFLPRSNNNNNASAREEINENNHGGSTDDIFGYIKKTNMTQFLKTVML